MLNVGARLGTISLSAGGMLSIPDWTLRGMYPDGTEAFLVFTNDAGAQLAVFDGEVTKVGISFTEGPDLVSGIPHGANFQLFVTQPGEEPLAMLYGTVVRSQPRWPLATVVDPENTAKVYTANFVGSHIGPKWVPMGGTGSLEIHGTGTPTMGPKYSVFSSACARWLWPMNMDSVTINVKVVNKGAGKFNVLLCGDSSMRNYLGVQFETGIFNNRVWIITGDGPVAWDTHGSAVNNNVGNGDVYTVKYNHLADTISCYKGTSLSPLIEASGVDVPHGEGFRYTGLSWNSALFTPGVEPSAWEAKDGV